MNQFEYKMIDTRDVESTGRFKGRECKGIEAYLNYLGRQD